jgi:hypothetical protein
MDFGIIVGVKPLDPSVGDTSFESFEPARYAMGDTVRFAERMNLSAMEPRGELSSTGYALANEGEEYLLLELGEAGDPFTATLSPGAYPVEWYSVKSRETVVADEVKVESSSAISFSAPFEVAGAAVLYLKGVGR